MKFLDNLFLAILVLSHVTCFCFSRSSNAGIDVGNLTGGIPDFKKSPYIKIVTLNELELNHSYQNYDQHLPPPEFQTLVCIARYPSDFEVNLYFSSRQSANGYPVMSLGKFKRHDNGEYSDSTQPNINHAQVYQLIPSDLFAPGERAVIAIKDLHSQQEHQITAVFNPISTRTQEGKRIFAYYYDMRTCGYLLKFEGFDETDELEIKPAHGLAFQHSESKGIFNCSLGKLAKTIIKNPNFVEKLMCCPSPINMQKGEPDLQKQGVTEVAILTKGKPIATLLLPYGRCILPGTLKNIYDEITS